MRRSSVWLVPLCLLCLLCLRLCLCQPSEVSLEIKVKPGEDVTLPCHSSGDAEVVLMKWTRPDLRSEGNILVYRDGWFQSHSQHPSYRGRVELKDPEMKNRDVSVILKNVTFNDPGTYECLVGNNGNKPKLISSINLTVQDSVTIPAEPGQSVSLPCRAPNNTEIIAVNWTRPGLEPEYVLMIRDGRPVTDNQHPLYQNRVELKDREMKDGDVSIILKNVKRDDAGTYECRVFMRDKSRSTEPISIVHLQVHQPGDKDENTGLGVGLIILIVVVVVVVVLVAGLIVYRKHRNPREKDSPEVAYKAAETDEPAGVIHESDPGSEGLKEPGPQTQDQRV